MGEGGRESFLRNLRAQLCREPTLQPSPSPAGQLGAGVWPSGDKRDQGLRRPERGRWGAQTPRASGEGPASDLRAEVGQRLESRAVEPQRRRGWGGGVVRPRDTEVVTETGSHQQALSPRSGCLASQHLWTEPQPHFAPRKLRRPS